MLRVILEIFRSTAIEAELLSASLVGKLVDKPAENLCLILSKMLKSKTRLVGISPTRLSELYRYYNEILHNIDTFYESNYACSASSCYT